MWVTGKGQTLGVEDGVVSEALGRGAGVEEPGGGEVGRGPALLPGDREAGGVELKRDVGAQPLGFDSGADGDVHLHMRRPFNVA